MVCLGRNLIFNKAFYLLETLSLKFKLVEALSILKFSEIHGFQSLTSTQILVLLKKS
jgi:hypothetical protein